TDSLSGTHGKNGWYTSASVSVSLTPTDATSGVAATYYTIDGGSQQTYAGSAFSITGEGSHKITFWSVDQAGNTEAAESDSFKIDSLAPTSAVSALPADTNSATFTVGWAGSDGQNGSGIATYTVYVSDNGGTFKPFQQNTTATSDPFTGQDGHTYAFYSLAADNAGNVQTVAGPSHSITVVFPASQLVVQAPSQDVAGGTFTVTVKAQNADGFTDPLYNGSVALLLSSGPSGGTLSGTTVAAVQNGVATFNNVSLNLVGGGYKLFAASTTDLFTATSSPITVVPTTHFSITGTQLPVPSTLTAGGSFTITITALTAAKTTDTSYAGTVRLTSTDPQAGYPNGQNVTLTAGRATATITLKTAGTQTVTAADITKPSDSGTSSAVTVSAAAASQLQVTAYPSPDLSGASHPFTVTALDPYNNVATTFRDMVTLSSSDPQAVLPVRSYTFTSLDNGSHTTFSATLATLGTQSLTATDTSNTKIPAASQSGISVQTATTHFSISGLPSTLTAGGSFTIIITALTAANSLDKTYAGTVQLSSTDLQAVFLVGGQVTRQLTFIAGTGTATATVTLKTAGTQTVSAADTTLATRSGTSSAVTVSAAAASQLQVMAYPSPDVSGVSHSFTVTALDPYNNVATTFRDKVALSSSDPSRILPVTSYTFTSLDNGQHPFSATLATLGTQSLTATDTSNAKVPAASQSGISVVNFTAGITPTSPATVPVLAVPGQPLTFALSASETGQAATTSFTYTVNWGDGTATKPDTQLVSGVSGTPVSHVYTTTGNFLAAVTAADAAGNVTPKAATVAAILSTVALEADPGDTTKTALFVGGTIGNDTISIVPTNAAGTSVSVKVNGVVQTIGAATTFAPTGHILVYGQAGNDTIQETAATINKQSVPVAVPALIFAGSGNDTLSVAGSSANNLLVGASGNDSLTGGAGRDILIGGNGASVLRAGTGGDILIPGSTSYTPTVGGVYNPNVPALLSLLAEWGRNTSYSARVQDLFAGASGDLNGGSLLNPSTVSLSAALDQLFAGSALDWLWFADNAKVVHQVSNLPSGGIATFE
ncbi:MAG TPA: PKD domain-containing protein, partial [Gemmataceae bacterium]|nr:PKD domain-containing protein [Gemmataceae bacterium]